MALGILEYHKRQLLDTKDTGSVIQVQPTPRSTPSPQPNRLMPCILTRSGLVAQALSAVPAQTYRCTHLLRLSFERDMADVESLRSPALPPFLLV